VIEGAYDVTLFEDVVFKMLNSIRTDSQTRHQSVLLFMDNASFHQHSRVKEVCRKMKVNLLYNA
jgi:hypothetical protein